MALPSLLFDGCFGSLHVPGCITGALQADATVYTVFGRFSTVLSIPRLLITTACILGWNMCSPSGLWTRFLLYYLKKTNLEKWTEHAYVHRREIVCYRLFYEDREF